MAQHRFSPLTWIRRGLFTWICITGAVHGKSVPAPVATPVQPTTQRKTYTVSKAACTFVAIGNPGFLRINGEGGKPTGTWKLEGAATLKEAEIRLPLAGFSTGIDKRDEHMRDKYLQIAKYPDAVLKVDRFSWNTPQLPEKAEIPATLTLHGITKPMTIPVMVKNQGKEIAATSDFTVLLSDFGIDIPSFAGLTMAKEVSVHVELTFL